MASTAKDDDHGEWLLLGLLLLFGFGLGSGSGSGSVPLPAGGPVELVVDARGYHVGGQQLGSLETPAAAVVELLGPGTGREIVVDTKNGPHFHVVNLVDALKTAGWIVSVSR